MDFIQNKVDIICGVLHDLMETTAMEIDDMEYIPSGYKETNTPPAADAGWMPFTRRDRVQGKDEHFWFHKKFRTPKAVEGKYPILELVTGQDGPWDATNPQCILYLNGSMVQGMDINHTKVPLEYDTEYDMYLYFYAGMIDKLLDVLLSVKLVDEKIEKLYYDLRVPYDALLCFERDDPNYINPLKELELALQHLDLRDPLSSEFYQSVDETIDYLDKHFYHGLCGKSDAVVSCIGHTHIDVAWLWTLAQTREKAQRSFSTVLNLMKKYPEYVFMSSQPQLYKYVKQAAPEVYEQIKEMVKAGRWEVDGAMWLEADCNLPSGESLVRQIIHGKRFMKEEFGVDSKVLWLPDVFGYSAALPQILKKSGVEKFVTSKISWNEFNKLPYDTFLWEGVDGTDIFTYFISARDYDKNCENDTNTTYVGYIRPKQVLGTWKRYQQKQYNNETLITFGFGDGGGGPTADMLEQQRRLQYGLPGLPRTQISRAGDFLDRVEKNFEENCKKLRRTPKWVGELYLELHRGTYTSIAKNKRNNRKSELLYQETEALCVADQLLCGGEYPQQVINNSWETILLNQFHDIIPGSSIFEVYEDCDRDYAAILKTGTEIRESKLSSLTSKIKTDGGLFVYNPLSYPCGGMVEADGKKVYVENIPAFGWKITQPKAAAHDITVAQNSMENKFYRITFQENGTISSIYDKTYDREVVKPGEAANELQIFEDFPKCYDAWEITNYYKQKMWTIDEVVSMEPVDEGERAGLKITKKFQKSTITQTIYLYEHSRRIDFVTEADWHERHILLKAAFPLNIHTSKATYDIQFGNLERPTHENTSWDAARFEVCAHKWADLSEDNYGVSLLNDCKYGHNAEGSTLKLSLLKCATYPNPEADQGKHTFTYSLLPHGGDFKDGGTVRQAYELNQPMICRTLPAQEGTLPEEFSLVSCEDENIIVETVKKAEDSDDIIIRLYECFNRKDDITLHFGFDFKRATLCDLMENDISPLESVGRSVTLPVKNFEIITLKLSGASI